MVLTYMAYYIQSCDVPKCKGVAEYPAEDNIICGYHSRSLSPKRRICDRVKKRRVSEDELKPGYYYYYACVANDCHEEAEYVIDPNTQVPTHCFMHEGYKMHKKGTSYILHLPEKSGFGCVIV